MNYPILKFPGGPGNLFSRSHLKPGTAAVDELPEGFRIGFVIARIEQMSVEETAAQLKIPVRDGEDQAARGAACVAEGSAGKARVGLAGHLCISRRTL